MSAIPHPRPAEFVRVAWTSDHARAVWEPRITRVAAAWPQIEIESVRRGLRRCALTLVPAFRVFELGAALAPDLVVLTLQTLAAGTAAYQAFEARQWRPGSRLNLRIAIGSGDDAEALQSAFAHCDDSTIGELLGYPQCCRDFFRQVCVQDAAVDPTWASAEASANERRDERTIDLRTPPAANLLLRWLGVRMVPHLPCAFDCSATIALGHELASLGRKAGFGDEMEWAEEMLSWPVEWSALHGVAEVRLPVVKIAASTDPTHRKKIVRVHGWRYPKEGARGLTFPYSKASALGDGDPFAGEYAANGFSSASAMRTAHAPLIGLATSSLRDVPGPLLDLGCGSGVLLEKIREEIGVPVYGVDSDSNKCQRAKRINPNGVFVAGDLFAAEEGMEIWNRRYGLILISAARILEAGEEQRKRLAERFGSCADRVLVYAYPDTPFDLVRLASSCSLRPVLALGHAAILEPVCG